MIIGFVLISGCATPQEPSTPPILDDEPVVPVDDEMDVDISDDQTDETDMQDEDQSDSEENGLEVGEFTIERTDGGFVPQEMTVKVGSTVIFLNSSSVQTRPASAIHPTHTAYPGSSIQKCNTEEEQNNFDACRPLAPEESYSFTFNEIGEWGFHDHLHVGNFGKVIVVE